jgi:hypothetical protein
MTTTREESRKRLARVRRKLNAIGYAAGASKPIANSALVFLSKSADARRVVREGIGPGFFLISDDVEWDSVLRDGMRALGRKR